MIRSKILRAILPAVGVALVLTLATAGLAHHGWSGYDASKPLNVTGMIREAGYEHPHGFLKLEASEKMGLWLALTGRPTSA